MTTIATITVRDHAAFVAGIIDFTVFSSLEREGLHSLLALQVNLFDFSAVTRANSAGLALMLSWLRCAGQRKCPVSFIHIPESLQLMAGVCGLKNILGMRHG